MRGRLSITELAVLGVLAEHPTHGFAIAKQLAPDAELGRVLTVRRPLVYRALDRLVETGHVEQVTTERGESGPDRVIHRITSQGHRRLHRWLAEPVEHVRDLRIEFLLKIVLLERGGHSPLELVEAQRAALADTFSALDAPQTDRVDPVELWRRHTATAAAAYLEDLAGRLSRGRISGHQPPLRTP